MSEESVERVKQSDGDLVLDFHSRIGARPYARYVDGDWDMMSLGHVPTPDYGQDNREVHLVDLKPDDVTGEGIRDMADGDGPGSAVQVVPFAESPFPDRDEIPARDDIVEDRFCPGCGGGFWLYLPDPQDDCPQCGAELPDYGVEA